MDLPGDARLSFVASACGGDSALLREVRSLLEADGAIDHPLDMVGAEVPPRASASDLTETLLGKDIGGYAILDLVGEGGMGAVYAATRLATGQAVALKILHPRAISAGSLARFTREVRILHRLDHPGVARIHDAGLFSLWGRKVPYIAMEYVSDARDIVRFALEEDLDVHGCLRLFLRVCDAVRHGHDQGVVHRDLKPANILVDGSGQPKVIDYGIAFSTDPGLGATRQTATGLLIGSFHYMSPEQFEGRGDRVDHRTDIHALGVVLYELLAGRHPFHITSLYDAADVIRTESPTPLYHHNPACRGGIDSVVATALAKDPEQRYGSVKALASDIRRALRGQPVLGRPRSISRQLRAMWRRHRTLSISVLVVLVVLAATSVISLRFALDAHRAREAAVRERVDAVKARVTSALSTALAALEVNDVDGAVGSLEAVPAVHRGWAWRHLDQRVDMSLDGFDADGRAAALAWSEDGGGSVQALTGGLDRRVMLWRWPVGEGAGPVRPACVDDWRAPGAISLLESNDTGTLAFVVVGSSRCFLLRVRENGGFSPAVEIPAPGADRREIACVTVCPTGSVAVAGTTGERGVERDPRGLLLFWDLATCRPLFSASGHADNTTFVGFSREGRRLVSCSYDGTARVWDVASSVAMRRGVCVAVLRGHEDIVRGAAFSPDTRRLATASLDGLVRVWDLAESERSYRTCGEGDSGTLLASLRGHTSGVRCVAFAPGGRHLVSGSSDRTIRFWMGGDSGGPESSIGDGTSWLEAGVLRGHHGQVVRLRFAGADLLISQGVCVYDERSEIRTWACGPVEDVPVLLGHGSSVVSVAASPGGELVASASGDGTVRIWDGETGEGRARLDQRARARGVAFHPRQPLLASGGSDGVVRIWKWSPDGGTRFRQVETLRPGETGRERQLWSVAFSDDGELLAAGGQDGVVTVWARARRGWARYRDFELVPTAMPSCQPVAFLGEERMLLTVTSAGTSRRRLPRTAARLLSLDGDEVVWDSDPIDGQVRSIAVRAAEDRTLVGLAVTDGTVRVLELVGATAIGEPRVLTGHTGAVSSVSFHPGEPLLASGSEDRTIRLWDLDSGLAMVTLRGHLGAVEDLAFGRVPSPRGEPFAGEPGAGPAYRLLSASTGDEGRDNSVRIWETRRSAETVARRARLRERSEEMADAVGPLLTGEPTGEAFVVCLERVRPDRDGEASRLVAFRRGVGQVTASVRSILGDGGKDRAFWSRVRRWVESLLTVYPEDVELRSLRDALTARTG